MLLAVVTLVPLTAPAAGTSLGRRRGDALPQYNSVQPQHTIEELRPESKSIATPPPLARQQKIEDTPWRVFRPGLREQFRVSPATHENDQAALA